MGGARKLRGSSGWRDGRQLVERRKYGDKSQLYAACLNRKRPRVFGGIIKARRQSAVIKRVILSPPIRQTRAEEQTRGNSTFERLLSQTPALFWKSLIIYGKDCPVSVLPRPVCILHSHVSFKV